MRIVKKYIGITLVIIALSCSFLTHTANAQTTGVAVKGKMTLTAEIVKIRDNYMLRAEKPAEVFTVLNPDPKILDGFITTGKTVQVEVQIVYGDNVNITTINGEKYSQVGSN